MVKSSRIRRAERAIFHSIDTALSQPSGAKMRESPDGCCRWFWEASPGALPLNAGSLPSNGRRCIAFRIDPTAHPRTTGLWRAAP